MTCCRRSAGGEVRGPGNGGVGQDAADVLDGRRRCDLDLDMCLVAYGLAMRTGLLIVDTRPSFYFGQMRGSVAAYGLISGITPWCGPCDRVRQRERDGVRRAGPADATRILQQDRGLGCPRDVLEPVARAYTTMRLSGCRPGRPAVTARGGLRRLWRSCRRAQRLNKRIVRAC